MGLRRFLLVLSAAIILVMTVVLWFFPSNEDFRTENRSWNGTGGMIANYAVKPLESLAGIADSPEDATLILIPYLPFTQGELEAVKNFAKHGGTLVLADDYGNGNQILEYLDLSARFSREALLDPLSNYGTKWLPSIPHLEESSLTDSIKSLVLNHATSLTNIAESESIAQSSVFSFLDKNGNQSWDEGEFTGSMPVVSFHDFQRGHIILIADASIFINGMAKMDGNREFIQNIAEISKSNLFLDQSHLPPSDLHRTKIALERFRSLLASPLGILLLVILLLFLTLLPFYRKRPVSPERSL